MFNLLLVTPYDFNKERKGAVNRVLGLVDTISKKANIMVLHQGPNMKLNNVRFFHYAPLINFKKNNFFMTDVINFYTSSIATSITKNIVSIAMTEEIDIIQVEQPYPFLPSLRAGDKLNKEIVLVLDEHNVELSTANSKLGGNFLNSVFTAMTLPYIKRMENIALTRSDMVLCVSEKDLLVLMQLYNLKADKAHIIPNGVDLCLFERAPYLNDYMSLGDKTIFFHGTLSWYPNMEAVNIILDYIAPKIENATFVICGPNPSRNFLNKVAESKNVKYLGYVNNLPSYIKSSDICIAPIMRGGGTKLKLLEYAAAGRPIVATYKAVEGLPFIDKKNALLFEKVDEDFIDAIKGVLSDEEFISNLGINAKKMAKTFDWSNIALNLCNVYKSLLEKNHR